MLMVLFHTSKLITRHMVEWRLSPGPDMMEWRLSPGPDMVEWRLSPGPDMVEWRLSPRPEALAQSCSIVDGSMSL